MVDYIIALLQCIQFYEYFKVHLATEVMSVVYAESDKIPDHSILECIFHINEYMFIGKDVQLRKFRT